MELFALENVQLNQSLNENQGHVFEEKLGNRSLLLETIGSLFVKHQNVFENVHEIAPDVVIATEASSQQCIHLAESHAGTEQFDEHNVERS